MTSFGKWLTGGGRALLAAYCAVIALGAATAQDRPARPADNSSAQAPAAESSAGAQEAFEEIEVPVANMAAAGRILREVSIAKAREGIPAGDGVPRIDTETSILYFRTTPGNVAAMRKILAQIEAGGGPPSRPAAARAPATASGRIYAVEIWLVQLQMPKGEVVDLKGPRGEMLTTLAGLEKEAKATILNHVYLTAEEGKAAQSMHGESTAVVSSLQQAGGAPGFGASGLGGRRPSEPPGGAPADPSSSAGATPRRVVAAVDRHQFGAQVNVMPVRTEGESLLLDLAVSKTYSGTTEEGTLVPTDSAGGGYRVAPVRIFETESVLRAPFGSIITAASQYRGGETPHEIRVLVLVNPL